MSRARETVTTALRETGTVAGTARGAARTTARSTRRMAGGAARQARDLAGRVEDLTGELGGRARGRMGGGRRRGPRGRRAVFLLGAGALGFAAVRFLKRTTATGAGPDAVTSGPAGSGVSGVPGTATGDPTAGVEVADAGAVGTGTVLPQPGPEPFPQPASGGPLFGTTSDGGYLDSSADDSLGSADFSGARPPRS